jgi:uncharacterized protein (TIGR02996 family)
MSILVAALSDPANLLARVIAHPHDRDAFAVLGDALMAAGDPRGELILLQMRRHLVGERADSDDELDADVRERELIMLHRAEWLGELAGATDSVAFTWRNGFVHAVRFVHTSRRDDDDDEAFDDLLGRLSRMPANELVREVTISNWPLTVERWEPVLRVLVRRGLPPNVETLTLRRTSTSYTTRIEHVAPLYELYATLSRLTTLTVATDALALGRIALPNLRSLELASGGLTRDRVRSIVDVEWPNLQRLAIDVGVTGERGCNVKPEHLRSMLDRLRAPKLRHLALRRAGFTDELAEIVARSPFSAQLETLDLANGTLSDSGAAELRALAHLRELDLRHAFLSAAMRDELVQLGPVVILDDPQSPDFDVRRPAD